MSWTGLQYLQIAHLLLPPRFSASAEGFAAVQMHGCLVFAKTWKAGDYLKKELYWKHSSCVTLELTWNCKSLSKEPFVEQKLCTAYKWTDVFSSKMCLPCCIAAALGLCSSAIVYHTCRNHQGRQARTWELLSRRAAFYEARLVWELIVPGSSDPSKSFHKPKWLVKWGWLIYWNLGFLFFYNMYVKKPLKHHQCLIIELSCFQQWNAVAFGTSEYCENGLLSIWKDALPPDLHLWHINLCWFPKLKILNFV